MLHQASKYSNYFYTNKSSSYGNIKKNNRNNNIKRNIKKIIMKILLFLVFLLIIFALLMFFLGSNIFKIKILSIDNIESQDSYNKVKTILEEQENKKFLIWNQSNFFLFNTDDFVDLIKNRSNDYFYNIEVSKKFPNKIEISLKERSPKILIVTKKGQAFFDEDANVSLLSASISNTFPILYIDEDIDLKNDIISSDNILFILNIYKKLPKYNFNISKLKIEIADDNKLIVEESRGFIIYFNMSKDADEQIDYLNAVIKEEIKDKLSQIQYIDLRFIPKVFYK